MKYIAGRTLIVCSLLLAGAVSRAEPQDAIDPQDVNRLATFADMEYPVIARIGRIQGVVVVRVVFDRQGRVTSATGLSGMKLLVDASLENVRKWTFKPGSGTSAVIVYDFTISDGACHDNAHGLFGLRRWNFATVTVCDPVIVG